jgi:hypothetical protein
MPEFNFVRSSYSSSGGECVEVARNILHAVAVRDSKTSDGPILRFSPKAWNKFTELLH